MTVLQGVLAGAGIMAVLMGFLCRMFAHYDRKNEGRFDTLRTENREAHAGIVKNIDGVKQDVRVLTQHLLDRGK